MDAFAPSFQAQLGVSVDGHGHRRSTSNVSSTTSGSSRESFGMLNHSLDNQSPSVVGPYRNSRSASICSLAPSETSVGASRPDRSRQSSISMPYPSRRPSDATDPEQMTWPPDATNLFQQLQDVQLSAPHSQGTQFTDNSQSSWPYQGAVAFPDGDLSMLTSNLYAPHVAVSAPDQFSSVMPMIRPSDASSMTFAANNQINVGEGADEAVSDKQREDQLAALAQAVRSAHTTSQSDKARSSFVQAWLGSNYVVWPEGNVSRQALYSSYSKVCEKFGVRGINSASFGKAVRAAFPQIKTRRLGVRGNSKYHYCGMRPSNMSEARLLAEFSKNDNSSDPYGHQKSASGGSEESSDAAGSPSSQSKRTAPAPPALNLAPPVMIPHDFPPVDEVVQTATTIGADAEHARELWSDFMKSTVHMLEAFQSSKYEQLEVALRSFYRDSLTKAEHRKLLEMPSFATLNLRGLASCFNACLGLLQDRALSPATESATSLHQFSVLKQVADGLETIMSESVQALGDFSSTIIELSARFGHLINRHLGLCQVVQALLGIINSRTAIEELSESWECMDFASICDQCALAINCHRNRLTWCFNTFGQLLKSPDTFSLQEVTTWSDQLVTALSAPETESGCDMSLQSILTRSSFVMTQLMRDLTLRSDRSFGAFQLLSLFFQEWISFTLMKQMTISEHAITASLTPPNTTCGATTAHSEDSLCLGPQPAVSGAGDLNISFSPRTAQLFAESAGATPQFASFGSIPMVEDQKTAMTTPMASSSWKRNSKDIPTGLGHDEGSSVPYWDPNVSAIPVIPTSPFISEFFPSLSSSTEKSESLRP